MHSEHRRHSGWRDTDRLDSFDCTIANLSELVCDVLDAAGSSSVAEVGAEHGLFTELLLAWGTGAEDRRVSAVDPYPRPRLVELAAAHPELELVQRSASGPAAQSCRCCSATTSAGHSPAATAITTSSRSRPSIASRRPATSI